MLFFVKDKFVCGMAGVRLLSGLIELSAALLMLKLNRVDQAMKINAVLAFIGPIILLTVMTIGLAGLAGKVSFEKMVIIAIGVIFIFIGVNK